MKKSVMPRKRGPLSTNKKQVHRMYIRRGFECLASDAWLVKCHSCYQYSMYNWTPKFPCKNSNCRGSCIFDATTVLHIPLEVYFVCHICKEETHLFRIGQFGFFICLKCFHRPSFGELCDIKYVYPEQVKYEQRYGRLNLDVNIEFPQRWNAITYKLQSNTRLDASIYLKSIERIFYPSKAICSRNWNGMLTKKMVIETLAWRCKHCHSLNEFEFTTKTPCGNCREEDDLTDFFQRLVGEERVSVEVVFTLACQKCQCEVDVCTWKFFHNGISCPVCCQFIQIGKIELKRTLRPWHSEVGEEKVITVQREDKWIYEMNTQFLSSFAALNEQTASSSQALPLQNIEKGIDDFDWGFEPSTSDAVSTQQRGRMAGMSDEEEDDEDDYNLQPLKEKFVKPRVMNLRGVSNEVIGRIKSNKFLALDVEFSFRMQDKAIHPFVVSLYGVREEGERPMAMLDCQWIKHDETGVKINWYTISTSGITPEVYLKNHLTGISIGSIHALIALYGKDKVIVHHGPNDIQALGLNVDSAKQLLNRNNILLFDTTQVYRNATGPFSLKSLAKEFIQTDIQVSSHTPTEDAIALYKVVKATIEMISQNKLVLSTVTRLPRTSPLTLYCFCHFTLRCKCECKPSYLPGLFNCKCKCSRCNFDRTGCRKQPVVLASEKDYFSLKIALNRK